MKVGIVGGAFYPSKIGGPANTLLWHSQALFNENILVDVLTTDFGIKKGNIAVNETVKYDFGNVFYCHGIFFNSKIFFELKRLCRTSEIVHLNSIFSYLSIITFLYLRIFHRGKKVVWSVRGELEDGALKYSKIKKKFILFLYEIFIGKETNFHATSTEEIQNIGMYFPNIKIFHLPNFIIPAQRLNQIVVKPQILFMGRIHEIKAIEKLIKAIYINIDFIRSHQFKLVIAGKCEKRHKVYLEHLILLTKKWGLENEVSFLGHVDGKEKSLLYAESYMLVLPSVSENFANVVPESLNQGTPVVASLGTPWGELDVRNAGLHVSNNPRLLGEAICKLIRMKPEDYSTMRVNSTNFMDSEFNVHQNIYKWKKIYTTI